MNGVEQRARHTAVTAIAARQANVETVVEALAGEIVKDRETVKAALRAEHVDRVDAVATLRDGLLAKIADERTLLENLVTDLRDRSFWGRLRWLLIGR